MGQETSFEELGVFLRDTMRSLVVLSHDGELAVALREELTSSMVVVRDGRPAEARTVLRACSPWPWIVVSDGTSPPPLVELAARAPALIVWLGDAPAELAPWRTVARYRDVVLIVRAALRADVAGMRLAPGRGVVCGARSVRSPALEALLCAYPDPMAMNARAHAQAERALASLATAASVQRDATGRVRLAARVGAVAEALPV